MNPELRQTFNTISRNFESANEAAQENIYSFTSQYIDPCLGGIKSCLADCTAPCFPGSEENQRRRARHPRGRLEYNFDFYDDWDEEEEEAVVGGTGWANDELDSLLAGRGQPRRQRAMSYGARARMGDAESDPTAIPKSSYLGFLESLPFRIGARVLHYRPSASGLQENPGGLRIRDVEAAEPLIADNEHDPHDRIVAKSHRRNRSDTGASRSTQTSRSARSDLIMSDEDEDAQPLDDEFAAVMLSRRTTGFSDDHLSAKSGSDKRPTISRISTRTFSNRSLHSDKVRRSSGKKSPVSITSEPNSATLVRTTSIEPPSMIDLRREEELLREQEELEIMQKRTAATKLALATGLGSDELKLLPSAVDVEPQLESLEERSPSNLTADDLRSPTPTPPDADDHSALEEDNDHIRSYGVSGHGMRSPSATEPFPEIDTMKQEVDTKGDPP